MHQPPAADSERDAIADLLGELAAVLRDEFEALAARRLDALTAAVARKSELIAALETATGKVCRNGRELAQTWPELAALAAQCAEANRVNGGAIALNRGLVSGLLDTLHGPRRTAPTYDAAGRVSRRDRARPVGTA